LPTGSIKRNEFRNDPNMVMYISLYHLYVRVVGLKFKTLPTISLWYVDTFVVGTVWKLNVAINKTVDKHMELYNLKNLFETVNLHSEKETL